ncbi:MAG: GNAT family N-acetyltransferase [Longimicrobiales bacterium]
MTGAADSLRLAIRRAGPLDARQLASLRYEFRLELAPPAESRDAFLSRCAAWMRERLASESNWYCWVLENQAQLTGMVWLQLLEKIPNPVAEPECHAYISSLYVTPDARFRGFGAGLLEQALNWARTAGAHAVILWPTERSRGLYQRHGFATKNDLMELTL